jgi:hypothetical protein
VTVNGNAKAKQTLHATTVLFRIQHSTLPRLKKWKTAQHMKQEEVILAHNNQWAVNLMPCIMNVTFMPILSFLYTVILTFWKALVVGLSKVQ